MKPVLPDPPYYAVIFISTRSENLEGYAEMDVRTIETAATIPGYLGYESIKEGNRGIFISYWKDLESIDAWRNHPLHKEAKAKGISMWYDRVLSQVCLVEQSREINR